MHYVVLILSRVTVNPNMTYRLQMAAQNLDSGLHTPISCRLDDATSSLVHLTRDDVSQGPQRRLNLADRLHVLGDQLLVRRPPLAGPQRRVDRGEVPLTRLHLGVAVAGYRGDGRVSNLLAPDSPYIDQDYR